MSARTLSARFHLLALAAAAALAGPAAANTLTGWAQMPAATFSDGPTSGQFAFTNASSPANNPQYVNLQPVQGFSGVLNGANGSFHMLVDNGFGSKANSPDALLRMYAVQVDWNAKSVSAADWTTGATLGNFSAASRITLRDPHGVLTGMGINTVYSGTQYPGSAVAVDAAIGTGKLLTGGDLDLESVRRDGNGNLWFGEEFGPFLVKTDATGVVQGVFRTPNVLGLGANAFVQSPQNPIPTGANNLPGSGGFEGMAINPAGDKLYTLLEKSVAGDAAGTLRINEFSIDSESYTGASFRYKLDAAGVAIGDMTALNDHEFIIIERNNATATGGGTPFKKLFRIDINRVDAQGYVSKTELVDLMNIADPNDLNGDGKTSFTFPFVTIESVLVLDANTLLIANDNNYPGTGGRDLGSDNTEFLKIQLANPVPEPSSYAMLLGGLGLMGAWLRRRKSV